MRKTVHICLTSHDEVLFRDDEDLAYCYNCLVSAALGTETRLLADGRLTTHHHFEIQTDNHVELVKRQRYPYSCYFNSKYGRKGRVGDRNYFCAELNDVSRITICSSYINRQGLHHGLASTPFGYPFTSANALFRNELGKDFLQPLMSASARSKFLPRTSDVPASIRMSQNGQLLYEDTIDIHYVEELYITPRNFLFHMNRFTDEKWVREQRNDCKDEEPVTLESVEKCVPDMDLKQLMVNERGRVSNDMIHDLDLCKIIDGHYVPRIIDSNERGSVYSLPVARRRSLGNQLYREIQHGTLFCPEGKNPRSVSVKQLSRCLGLNEE